MDADQSSRIRVMFIVLGLLSSIASWPTGADAAASDYVESRRVFWKPTYGVISTSEPENCATTIYCHRVEEIFTWEEWPALARVDSPRTPSKWGTYEHELRFYDRSLTQPLWCDYRPPNFYTNAYFDLPLGWYEDTVDRDTGEFSFGVPTWRLVEDHWYDIRFNCSPERDTLDNTWPDSVVYTTKWSGVHNVLGQIGHCHTTDDCDSFNVYADTTNALISKAAATAPDFEQWYLSFTSDYSLECTPGACQNPSVSSGSAVRTCTSSRYHGSCYWNVRPSSSSAQAKLYFTGQYDVPSIHGNNDALSEWIVRCPSSQNSVNCTVRLYIDGLASSGAPQGTYYGPWVTIPRDNVWRTVAIRTQADNGSYNFDFGQFAAKWRFNLQGGSGVYYDADYHIEGLQL